MVYCKLCNEWLGFLNTDCDNEKCDLTSKLIDLYGIDKIGDALETVFIRSGKAVDFRSKNIDKIKEDDKKSDKV